MTALRNVRHDLATHFADAHADLTLHGSSAGGVWPGVLRPASADYPAAVLAVDILAAEEPVQWINAGSFSRQMHQGRFRATARGAVVGQYKTINEWLRAVIEYAHSNRPSGYSDLRFTTGLPMTMPTEGPQELPIMYADGRYRYFEDP